MGSKITAALLILPVLLCGHKITVFAVVEGTGIYTRTYASDGTKIKDGAVQVLDPAGRRLLSGRTDSLGEFSFAIPRRTDLKIVVEGGLGHRAETVVRADQLPDLPAAAAANKPAPSSGPAALDTVLIRRLIGDAVRDGLQPVVRRLAELERDRISFTEIIGGIGYIFGILGLAMFFARRKKCD